MITISVITLFIHGCVVLCTLWSCYYTIHIYLASLDWGLFCVNQYFVRCYCTWIYELALNVCSMYIWLWHNKVLLKGLFTNEYVVLKGTASWDEFGFWWHVWLVLGLNRGRNIWKNQAWRLFRPRSIYLCHQKPNLTRKTVPSSAIFFSFPHWTWPYFMCFF